MEIGFGAVDDTWGKYGLEQRHIRIDGRDTSYKAIFRDGRLVRVLGSDYYLFPNEEALRVADTAAEMAGLSPFSVPAPGLKSMNHVLYNREETRMRALYSLGRVHRVDGDEVNLAVSVFNAIDGTSSFGCGLFTYRRICGNGVIMGRENLVSVSRIHTKGLQAAIEGLKARMVQVMEEGVGILDSYRRMAQQKVTDRLVDKILTSRLPLRVLPDYLREEEARLPDISEWTLYNDITERIWHSAKTDLQTKTFQFNTLHGILLPPRRL